MIYSFDWNDPERDTKLFLSKLWDMEYFNPWDAKEPSTVAYMIARLYQSRPHNEYMNVIEKLFRWLGATTWNEFSLMIAYKTNELIDEDQSVDDVDVKLARQRYNRIMSDCQSGKITTFWVLDEKYAPEWFQKTWPSWVKLKEDQMRSRFIENFNALKWDNEDAETWYNRFKNQDPQLLYELDQCLKRKRYKNGCALEYKTLDDTLVTATALSQEYVDEPIIGIYIRMFLLRQ